MKDWVKPFLNQYCRCLNECNEYSFYWELMGFLKHDFVNINESDQDIVEKSNSFTIVFGSVLADLDEEVFKQLWKMKNLFFIFTPCPGPEVKLFQLENDLRKGDLIIVNFPYSSIDHPPKTIRGLIIHELAHIYVGHKREHQSIAGVDMEYEADEIAREWGFKEEIEAKEALRIHWGQEEDLRKK